MKNFLKMTLATLLGLLIFSVVAMLIGFGVVVALGTGILLVTKKRMGMIKD